MGYLLAQIFFCLLLAFLLGLLVGWFLGRFFKTRELLKLQQVWKANLFSKEEELKKVNAELADCRKSAMTTGDVSGAAGAGTPVAVGGDEKDDLQLIWGIGPFLERRLNEIGFKTYRQIATLTAVDIDKIGRHIRHFPKRVRRDKWPDSARELYARKYGKPL